MILGLFLSPCSGFAADPVKIGVMAPVTGTWASEVQQIVYIIELLTEEVNKAGGRQIIIEIDDDGENTETAALAAKKLISSGVVAVIGTYGSAITEATSGYLRRC